MKTVISYEGVEFKVDFDYDPGERGRMTLANGDPGYPDTPPSVTVNKVMLGDADMTFLLDLFGRQPFFGRDTKGWRYVTVRDHFEEACGLHAEEARQYEAEARAEARADAQEERMREEARRG